MADDDDRTVAATLIRLAAAQDRFADEEERLAEALIIIAREMREMNGAIKGHNTQLALSEQWADHHTGDDSVHAMLDKKLDALEKLAKTAIAIPTIIVVGGAIAGILALVI